MHTLEKGNALLSSQETTTEEKLLKPHQALTCCKSQFCDHWTTHRRDFVGETPTKDVTKKEIEKGGKHLVEDPSRGIRGCEESTGPCDGKDRVAVTAGEHFRHIARHFAALVE